MRKGIPLNTIRKINMDERRYDIATATTSRSVRWKNISITWKDFVESLRVCKHTDETLKQFFAMSKEDQGVVKDSRGGYVGGYVAGGKRRKGNVQSRSLMCLDADEATADFFSDFCIHFSCAAIVHGTHKHTPEHPRLRLVIPLSRDLDAEAYEAVGRKITSLVGIDMFDRTTYEAERLMYYPTAPKDVRYYFDEQEGGPLDVDEILNSYTDWRDRGSWALHKGEGEAVDRTFREAEDPRKKKGLIGAFCRAYGVKEVIESKLKDVYDKAGEDRYTYLAGSSFGGLVVYNDLYCYSRHDHDPANNGHAVNAYDLLRIHKFTKGYTEESAKEAVKEYLLSDKRVTKELMQEQSKDKNDLMDDFSEIIEADWQRDKKGNIKSTIANYKMLLQTDKFLKGLIAQDKFLNKLILTRDVPWREEAKGTVFTEIDKDSVRERVESILECYDRAKVDSAINIDSTNSSYHPIVNYLESLNWDGVKRVDTALIKFLGAEDNIYVREAFRIMLLGAISRVYKPGYKFDTALIMYSGEGAGKSTFVRKLGKQWSTDSITTIGKTASFEQLQGKWIVELAELSALQKSDIETTKLYISKQVDTYRPAYGHDVIDFKRQCIFFGSTNKIDFLQDVAGNRRFLPVTVKNIGTVPFMISDKFDDVVDQMWAEALVMYNEGTYQTILSEEAEAFAVNARTDHYEGDSRAATVEQYLDKEVPSDWEDMTVEERKSWLRYPDPARPAAYVRDRISVIEVWVECFNGLIKDLDTAESRSIKRILDKMDGWGYSGDKVRTKNYGRVRCYGRLGADMLN